MLPLVSRSTQEVLALVPASLREASQALGVSKWRTVLQVVLPTTLGGILTGATLAIARAAARPRRSCSPRRFSRTRPRRSAHAGRDGPVGDLHLLRVARSEPARAGVGGGVRPDHLRAPDEPGRAVPPSPQPAEARADLVRRLRTFDLYVLGWAPNRRSPRFSTGSHPVFSPRRAARPHGGNVNRHLTGEIEKLMKLLLRSTACRRRSRRRCSSVKVRAQRGAPANGSQARAAPSSLRLSRWSADYSRRPERRSPTPGRHRCGHPGGHEPPGRLRRLRRAAHARPVPRLQRLRPDPVGAVRTSIIYNLAGRAEQPEHDRAP